MRDNEVHINDMTLRIPGIHEQEARQIGQEVMQHIAENLPDSFQTRQLDNLHLRVNISPGMPRSEMTRIIAEDILKGLL